MWPTALGKHLSSDSLHLAPRAHQKPSGHWAADLIQVDPGWRVVRRFFLAPRPFVDARAVQPVGRLGRAEQMVEPEAEVPLPAAGGIVPEGVELLFTRV